MAQIKNAGTSNSEEEGTAESEFCDEDVYSDAGEDMDDFNDGDLLDGEDDGRSDVILNVE
jgi:hypothetical protein